MNERVTGTMSQCLSLSLLLLSLKVNNFIKIRKRKSSAEPGPSLTASEKGGCLAGDGFLGEL